MRESRAPKHRVVPAHLESERKRWQGFPEHHCVPGFPDVPAAEEDGSWPSFSVEVDRPGKKMKISDVRVGGDQDPDVRPECRSMREMENHMTCVFQRERVARAGGLLRGDDGLTTRKRVIGRLAFCGAPLTGAPHNYFCGAWMQVRHRNF